MHKTDEFSFYKGKQINPYVTTEYQPSYREIRSTQRRSWA